MRTLQSGNAALPAGPRAALAKIAYMFYAIISRGRPILIVSAELDDPRTIRPVPSELFLRHAGGLFALIFQKPRHPVTDCAISVLSSGKAKTSEAALFSLPE
jgi:hypothetical protein